MALGFSEAQADRMLEQSGPMEIWPENWQAVMVFAAMGTQWTVGNAGVIGLRYESLPVVMRHLGVPPPARAGVFADLRILESAAKEAMRG